MIERPGCPEHRAQAVTIQSVYSQCNGLSRTTALKSLNPQIADMAEEDSLYREAGLNFFGEGFCRKAKERDKEANALNNLGATNSDEAWKNPSRPFFLPVGFPQRKAASALQQRQRETTLRPLTTGNCLKKEPIAEVTGGTTAPDATVDDCKSLKGNKFFQLLSFNQVYCVV